MATVENVVRIALDTDQKYLEGLHDRLIQTRTDTDKRKAILDEVTKWVHGHATDKPTRVALIQGAQRRGHVDIGDYTEVLDAAGKSDSTSAVLSDTPGNRIVVRASLCKGNKLMITGLPGLQQLICCQDYVHRVVGDPVIWDELGDFIQTSCRKWADKIPLDSKAAKAAK